MCWFEVVIVISYKSVYPDSKVLIDHRVNDDLRASLMFGQIKKAVACVVDLVASW